MSQTIIKLNTEQVEKIMVLMRIKQDASIAKIINLNKKIIDLLGSLPKIPLLKDTSGIDNPYFSENINTPIKNLIEDPRELLVFQGWNNLKSPKGEKDKFFLKKKLEALSDQQIEFLIYKRLGNDELKFFQEKNPNRVFPSDPVKIRNWRIWFLTSHFCSYCRRVDHHIMQCSQLKSLKCITCGKYGHSMLRCKEKSESDHSD